MMSQKITDRIALVAIIALILFAAIFAWGCSAKAASPTIKAGRDNETSLLKIKVDSLETQLLKSENKVSGDQENSLLKARIDHLETQLLKVENKVAGDQQINDPVVGWLAVLITPFSFICYTLANRFDVFLKMKHGSRYNGKKGKE